MFQIKKIVRVSFKLSIIIRSEVTTMLMIVVYVNSEDLFLFYFNLIDCVQYENTKKKRS